MNRTRVQWALFEPVIAAQAQSRAVIQHALLDAKKDIAELYRRNDELLAALKSAKAEIDAAGLAEGVFFGDDPLVEQKIDAAIAKCESQS